MDFGELEARNYISVFGMSAEEIKAVFGQVQIISEEEECAFITGNIKENDLMALIERSKADVRARIRLI